LELPGITLVETNDVSSEVVYSTETHETQVDLHCVPTESCRSFTVSALNFNIAVGDTTELFKAHVPINVRGQRLFSKKHEVNMKLINAREQRF
jgi:hypothetical protein